MFPASNGTPQQALLILLYASCLLLSMPFDASRHVAAASPPISFSFDFTDSSSYDPKDLRFEGDAAVNGSLVNLAGNSLAEVKAANRGYTGRMSYGRPVPLYDATTEEVASFATRFTFNIKLLPGHAKGDGMAFFLVGYPSEMPTDSAGGAFGLTNENKTIAYGPSRFVAVEFDTYNNTDFDPQETMDHIGIDLSSFTNSYKTTSLPSFSLNGTMTASINFNSSTGMLVARLHFDDNPSMQPVEVSAKLPNLDTLLPPEVAVGFSAATGSAVELHQILSWSFMLGPKETKSIGTGLIAAAIVGGACVFLLVVWFILSWFRWKRGRSSLMVSGVGPRQFRYRDLAHATNNFSRERRLGEGAFGAVYLGTSFKVDHDGEEQQVAVKELLKGSGLGGTKDFLREVNTISKTKHKNLVRLEGWCCYNGRSTWCLMFWCCRSRKQLDDHKLFLVYELMARGDLDHHLHEKDVAVLQWPARYKIVKGVGSALVYLHHDCVPYILHRDVKPGNILLDDNYNAKLADFGLSRIANKNDSTVVTTTMGTDACRLSRIANKSISTVVITSAVGTDAYMDPKFKVDGDVTFDRSADVYSFGLVLLEIACGRRNSRKEVWDLYERSAQKLNVEAIADERLGGDFDIEQMQRVLVVGLWCSLPEGADRPSMREAMRLLEHDELPHLTSSVIAPCI